MSQRIAAPVAPWKRASLCSTTVRAVLIVNLAGVGAVGAALASRLLESSLFAVAHLDLATFLTLPLILGVVTLLAILSPARRALRVDPVIALRRE